MKFKNSLNFNHSIIYKCLNIHVLAKWPECHNLVSYQTKMAYCSPNFLRKSQKSPIFDQKCSCLVTLRSGSTEIQFQPELPELYIFRQKIGDFLKKNCQISTKTSGNSPNCDILAIWAMHVWLLLHWCCSIVFLVLYWHKSMMSSIFFQMGKH